LNLNRDLTAAQKNVALTLSATIPTGWHIPRLI